ncbi:hypothetical protein CLV30_11878 [Haloactinopolyspora alba]|uniref:Uncharacterized protein n=1 Tax=Haloactinopolyspora alba TaxID=648780 RepID=A0A2P8DPM8_9ACTN|nr:hypothetical protein [Haloactinopolyspora alba]PSK99177.1 hypothetical protein CLV30_11878 [Haloactinopolyspora alba]
MPEEQTVEKLVRQAVVDASRGDAPSFASAIGRLERQGWDKSGITIIESLLRATEELPSVGPAVAAELTRRVSDRFRGSLKINRPIMEAIIRGATDDREASHGVPRDLSATYSLLVVGQLVHERYLTVDEALGSMPTEVSPADFPDQGD